MRRGNGTGSLIGLVFLTSAAIMAVTPLWGDQGCLDDPDFYRSFPVRIGKEDQIKKFAYALPCDTMIVRKGVTATVFPGAMVHFKNPSLNTSIRVEGTLILDGTKSSFIQLSGSVDTSTGSLMPGEQEWGGIEVTKAGKLIMRNAGILKAPTAMVILSPHVTLVNAFFQGSTGFYLPDGSQYFLEKKWHVIDSLDLEEKFLGKKAERSPWKNGEAGGKPKGFWTAGRMVGATAAFTALGLGAGTYFYLSDEDPKTPLNPNNQIPPLK